MDDLINLSPKIGTQKSTTYKSACRMCHGGCGVLVHVENGDIQEIEGDPDNPMNKGKLCPLGAASLQQIYNPKRLKYPMRRVGERGEGR